MYEVYKPSFKKGLYVYVNIFCKPTMPLVLDVAYVHHLIAS